MVTAGQFKDQGYVSGGVVQKNSVRVLVMLTQAFAMISDYDDERVFVPASLLQIPDKAAQGRIGVGDLAVVQTIFISLRVRRGRFVGIVRIVEVDPNKMRAGGMRGHPGFRMLHNFHAAPLYPSPARLGLRMLGEVVVEIESAIQARR